jgi:hypothetical protein
MASNPTDSSERVPGSTGPGIPTPQHLALLRKAALAKGPNGHLELSVAEAIGLLDAIEVTVEALKAAGFCTADPTGDLGHEMGKAHGIIHSALRRLGEAS